MIMPSESKVSGVCCAFLVVGFSCSLASASPDGEERITVTASQGPFLSRLIMSGNEVVSSQFFFRFPSVKLSVTMMILHTN